MKHLTLLFILINILIASAQVDYTKYCVSKNHKDFVIDGQGNINWDEGEFMNLGHILWPTKDELRITHLTSESENSEQYDWAFFNWRFDERGPDGEDSYFILEEKKIAGMVSFYYDAGEIWLYTANEDGKLEILRVLGEVSFGEKSKEDIRKKIEYIPQTQRKN